MDAGIPRLSERQEMPSRGSTKMPLFAKVTIAGTVTIFMIAVTVGVLAIVPFVGGVAAFFGGLAELGDAQRKINNYLYLEGFTEKLDYKDAGVILSTTFGYEGETGPRYTSDKPPRMEIAIRGAEAFAILKSQMVDEEKMACEVSEDLLVCTKDDYRAELRQEGDGIVRLITTETLSTSQREAVRAQQEAAADADRLVEFAPEAARIEKLFSAIDYASAGDVIFDEVDPDHWLRHHREILYSGTDSYSELKQRMLSQGWSCEVRMVNGLRKSDPSYEVVDCTVDSIRIMLSEDLIIRGSSIVGKNLQLKAEVPR